jgi:hypothetical protein
MHIEPLEPRIAPAAVFSFTDADGDLVTVKSSKGTNAQLEAALTLSNSGMGKNVDEITLGAAIYKGADFSIDAKIPPTGTGDGLVKVAKFTAGGVNLGKVRIDGDLLDATIGDLSGIGYGVKSLVVHTLGKVFSMAPAGITLNHGVGFLDVKAGMFGANSLTIEGPVGKLIIGGDIVNNGSDLSSFINISGKVGTFLVKGSLHGGDKDFTSSIVVTADVKSLTVQGSLFGAKGKYSGGISVAGKVGAFTIGGSIFQGEVEGAGAIYTKVLSRWAARSAPYCWPLPTFR